MLRMISRRPKGVVAWIPACAGMTKGSCHPRGSGGPVLHHLEAWIPACAGMTERSCHPRGSGGPVLHHLEAWIPACAGMTFLVAVGHTLISGSDRQSETPAEGRRLMSTFCCRWVTVSRAAAGRARRAD